MHERSPKSSAMDVLLYEREMLQHCAETVNSKQVRFTQSLSDQDRAEWIQSLIVTAGNSEEKTGCTFA